MKGVVLAGGLGSRLYPLTKITNKHLLPVFDKPMIYYPIQCLVNAGITEIMVVTGGNYAGHFLQLLRNGSDFGLRRLGYAYQEGEGGIADALKLAEEFADGDSICVVLGDNSLKLIAANAEQEEAQEEIEVNYTGEPIDVGFNVGYLLDVLNNVHTDEVQWSFNDANSSALVTVPGNDRFKYVIMPMRI